MDNREDTKVSIITYANNRFTCYAKKVCINLTNSIYVCLIYPPLFFINCLHKKLYFFQFVKVSCYISDSDNIVSMSLLPITICVSIIQHSIC